MKIEFILTEDSAMLEDYFRIRYERFVEEMKAEPENKEQQEKDHHDLNGHCHYVLAIHGKEVIGGCRLIDRRKTKLPIENHLFEDERRKLPRNCVELSRYALKRNCNLSNEEEFLLLLSLNDYVDNISSKLGFEIICANIRAGCMRLQKIINPNMRIEVIGKTNFHPGAGKLIPVILENATAPLAKRKVRVVA